MSITIHRAICKKDNRIVPIEWRVYPCSDGGVVIYPQNAVTGKKGGFGPGDTFYHLTSLADYKRAARLCESRLLKSISRHGWHRIG